MGDPGVRKLPERLRLGLRANMPQFALLVGVNALVGGMVGQERTLLPLLATNVFGLTTFTSTLTFLVAFGITKAIVNALAGSLADRFGRRPVLLGGWAAGLPVPLLIIWAPSWSWIVLANVLLGVNQGLTWSTTVNMKIDLVGPGRRGLAMGLNEASGYGAVAATALATGFIAARSGLRPEPFFLGIAYSGLGLALSSLFVRETRQFARQEAADSGGVPSRQALSTREVFTLTTIREPALSACSQAGLVNNLNDALAWGVFPLFFARGGMSIGAIGVLTALYPAVWGLGQLVTGVLSDRWGRKRLIFAGMWVQALSIAFIGSSGGFGSWAAGSVGLGVGTAMVYPTLLAAISDVAHPGWRASSLGVYRFWRDLGFALGGLLTGIIADAYGLRAAIWAVAGLTAASGLIVALRMYETLPRAREAGISANL
ncbi:MAG TPA: MFS transporter, partial [Actinomycetota bacterium]|nr:MFS transporter [Actinomycetota bacterium]